MDAREDQAQDWKAGETIGLSRLATAWIVVANAVPVVGVWFLGWQAERPIFFYWLDGLLAMWGLGVVAAVVTVKGGPKPSGATGVKLWLFWLAVVGMLLAILAIPSVVAGAMVVSFLGRDLGGVLRDVLGGGGFWTALGVVVGSYAWQTFSELRWKPELTLKETGAERGNLFIHRTLLMGMLVAWKHFGQPPRWALAVYVLIVACLFTYSQLYPDRYMEMIGFKRRAPEGRAAATAEARRSGRRRGAGGPDPA